MSYANPTVIRHDAADIIRPPRRVTVAQTAAEVVYLDTPGGYSGPWRAEMTPYMIEPMNALKSRRHEAVVFVAPARSGKTMAMLDGWLSHIITADPGDTGFYFSTQALAHDYRKRRIERLHRHSQAIKEKLSARGYDTTVEMITYRNGVILNLGWPSSSQLAQRDLRYVALSDYDSFPDDVGGEGSPFDLAKKRIQVAMSAGMALVESSPKRPIVGMEENLEPGEAPPVNGGILPLYNRGDRRRWCWECIDGCRQTFEAPACPVYDESENVEAMAASAHVACPHCGTVYRQDRKSALNASGVWIGAREARIASFWLHGCAAAFQTWPSIVSNYLNAKRHFEQTSDENALISTINTDQGLPYRPKALAVMRGSMNLLDRRESIERFQVPEGVRVLFAAVDVQSNRFEVAVWGYGPGRERWLVDRFSITETEDGLMLEPAFYVEHWDVLIPRVINATYRLPDDMELRVRRVAIDSGGQAKEGGEIQVTSRAYEFWRKLRHENLARRVWLVKGEKSQRAALVRKTYPDSTTNKQRSSWAQGDVPVLLLNTDRLKDAAHIDLEREVEGPGYIHLPDWIPRRAIVELNSEKREAKGWVQVASRNETWDLLVYADGLWHFERCEHIKWDRPPAWANPWERNSERISKDQGQEIRKVKRTIRLGSQRRGLIR